MAEYDLEDRATEFAKAVIRLCKNLPKNSINDRIISQTVGAAGSIGANYREANDSLGKKDFLQRLKIARREAKEAEHWLNCILEANDYRKTEIFPLLNEVIELKKILSQIIINSEKNQKNNYLELDV